MKSMGYPLIFSPLNFDSEIFFLDPITATIFQGYFGLSPLPVAVTTRNITFLVGDPYKPSFATVREGGQPKGYLFGCTKMEITWAEL